MKNEIPTAEFITEMSIEGRKEYERNVLEGPLFRKIVQGIEDAALEGYSQYVRTLNSSVDDQRAMEVIQQSLQEAGYYCEFETTSKQSFFFGEYKESCFVVDWSGNKT